MWAILKRIVDAFALDERGLNVGRIQEEIEHAIAASGFRLKSRKVIVIGRQVIVHISPEAMEVLRPLRRFVVADVEEHLPARLRKEGWELSGDDLNIDLTVDPTLAGYAMRAVASDIESTADLPESNPAGRADRNRRVSRTSRSAFLTLLNDDSTTWEIPAGRTLKAGRADSGTEIALASPYVSALHAELEAVQGGVMVTDRSKHGTTINGRRLRPDAPTKALHGDVIQFGSSYGVSARVTLGDGHLDITADLG